MTGSDKIQEAKGKVKKGLGDATDNEEMRDQGEADELKGKVSEKIADLREKADEGVDELRQKIKK